jgi:phosphoribosylformimino-5-aminoimidazole carboxamide ribonucleotide (ProFAR) isomerase
MRRGRPFSEMTSLIIPALDLHGGRVVTLRAGDLTPIPDLDPVRLADRWARFGPLNLVDLDAALGTGGLRSPSRALVEDICRRHECRVAGGVRSPADVEARLAAGAAKVVLASALFSDRRPELDRRFLAELSARVPRERLVFALDVRAGEIRSAGWRRGTGLGVEAVAAELAPLCSEFVLTAIDREGTAAGPDLDAVRRLREWTPNPVAVAGGITTAADVAAVVALGAHAIVGMAVHEGTLDLTRAFVGLVQFGAGGRAPAVIEDETGAILARVTTTADDIAQALAQGTIPVGGDPARSRRPLGRVRMSPDRTAIRFILAGARAAESAGRPERGR